VIPAAPPTPSASSTPRTPNGSARATLLLLTVAFVAQMVVQSVLFPVFRAPDEANHVDMARHTGMALMGGGGEVVHRPDAVRPISQAVTRARALSGLSGAPGQMPPREAAAAPPRPERPSFAALASGEATQARNQMTQHPPAYYLLAGALAAPLERAGTPYDLQVVLLRLLGVALMAVLPAAAWWTAGRLGADRAGRTVAALVPCAIPMVAHIGASVNSDVLVVALMGLLTPLLLRVAQRPRVSWWLAIAVGVLAGAALLTKGFALVTLPWLALAFLVGVRRGSVLRRLAQLFVAAALALAGGGWWWLRNLLVLGEVQPSHASVGLAPADFIPDWGWWAGFAAQRFLRRFWIEPDTVQQVPPWEAVAALLLVAGLAYGSWRALRRRRGASLLVALLPAVLLLGIVGWGAAQAYVDTGRPFGLNGRYLFGALPGIAGVVGLVTGTRARALAALLTAAVVTAGMQAWAWTAALGFYWGTQSPGPADELRAVAAWSPLPPALVGAAAVLAPLALLAALARELRGAARGSGSIAVSYRLGARETRETS